MNKSEIKFFNDYLNINVNSKDEVKKIMHQKYDFNFPLTNLNNKYNFDNDISFYYEYQRYDSKLNYKNFEKNFYNLTDVHSKTFFTSCGMSSIYSVLYSLSKNGKYKFKYAKDIYFETQKLIRAFNFNIGKKIFYFDSISDDFWNQQDVYKSIIIIDTTCYHPFDVTNMIKELLKKGNFIILVRSHIKLDMLGLEYCYLGSITFLIPDGITSKKFEKYKSIIKTATDISGNIGTFANQNNVFPLLNNVDFINLNRKRIKRINDNNKYFYDKVKDIFNITLHRHYLFLTISVSNNNFQELLSFIKKISLDSNGLFNFSSSFGFDYIAVDTYYDLNRSNNTIRVSIGDVTKKIIDDFIDYLVEKTYDKI